MPKNVPFLFVAMLILVIILLMMCAFQVQFTETVVVTRTDGGDGHPHGRFLPYRITRSADGGWTWGAPARMHDDAGRVIGVARPKLISLGAGVLLAMLSYPMLCCAMRCDAMRY